MSDRYEPLPPSQLNSEQQRLYNRFESVTGGAFSNMFTVKNKEDAFIGPFAPLMHTPSIAEPFLNFSSSLGKLEGLPSKTREVVILATGSVYKAGYELYAHRKVGLSVGLSEHQINAITVGIKPVGENKLTEQEETAFDVAIELAKSKGPLSKASWDRATKMFGKEGTAAVIHYVGMYAYVCILLNGVDASVPQE